mmetsp:Transcript_4460/g.5177  ORF Transcript_4460/g.5177 Transcript_4460/m.5177 type:complete len:192 (-) Transcript_4460:126-701(-)|eukprot:CAMPEP_0184010278 /NCGR_PEP_ID=MMETSP0954-20121128/3118_1 /TAXON_ID=627963 /ORGANISM="Aplanochytrium sp, Strain PBS07" /LENGTH=191 /DNA_ID=CAMNT_0026289837 /DNA_START=159 /DNA_END=734 /DNA_ORIENTATION=+
MATLEDTWQDTMVSLFDAHGVREPLLDILTWENPKETGMLFVSGVMLYVVTNVLNLGLMMVIGIIAILQLLLFRVAKYIQDKGIALSGVDLKKEFVVTPKPETVSTVVHVVGDMFRLVEETIKSLALSKDYLRLLEGFVTLIFVSAVGRVMDLPSLLLLVWTLSFVVLPVYKQNEAMFDGLLGGVEKLKGE